VGIYIIPYIYNQLPLPSLTFLIKGEVDTQVVHKEHVELEFRWPWDHLVHDYVVHTKIMLEQSQCNKKQQFYQPSARIFHVPDVHVAYKKQKNQL
jgi:hypothetical protein